MGISSGRKIYSKVRKISSLQNLSTIAILGALVGILSQTGVMAHHGSPKNCFECAALATSSQSVKMCMWDGNFLND